MFHACKKEIVALHQFFQDWFTDSSTDPKEPLRLSRALSPEFRMVTPSGQTLSREQVIQSVGNARGVHTLATQSNGFQIRIVYPELLAAEGALSLVTYQEWQNGPSGTTGRQSTVLFQQEPSAPEGVSWVHLQETWLPEALREEER